MKPMALQLEENSSKPSKADLALSNLLETCKSRYTRIAYEKSLRYFTRYVGLEVGEYDKLLQMNPIDIQRLLCSWICELKKTKSSATISTYVSSIIKFLQMNDVLNINYPRIRQYQPEKVRIKLDRAYTREEIQTLLEKADYRDRSMILLMSSSGLRVGALPDLKLRHLIPIDRYNIFKVIVYEGTKSQYYSFTSPETRSAIEKYYEYRKRCGEQLTNESYVFRGELNYRLRNKEIVIPHRNRPLSPETIRQAITELQKQTGLDTAGQVHNCHGFRKYFFTEAIKSGMSPLYASMLMGHSLGMVQHAYIKINESELLEGNDKQPGYITIINDLMIDESQRLMRENNEMRIKMDKIDKVMVEFEDIKRKIGIS